MIINAGLKGGFEYTLHQILLQCTTQATIREIAKNSFDYLFNELKTIFFEDKHKNLLFQKHW